MSPARFFVDFRRVGFLFALLQTIYDLHFVIYFYFVVLVYFFAVLLYSSVFAFLLCKSVVMHQFALARFAFFWDII